MAENQPKRTLFFHGERMTWISPVNLDELLDLKAAYPKAPLVVGNTNVGMYDLNVFCCHCFSLHGRSGTMFVIHYMFLSVSLGSSMLELQLWNKHLCLCLPIW